MISFCVDMHLIDAKCNNTIITSLFHFASTFATQNVIKNQNEINYYIITKRAATMPDKETKLIRRVVTVVTSPVWVPVSVAGGLV